MKPITQLILIFLLTFTVVPVYGDEDHKGMWACMLTEDFGYENGKVTHFKGEKFIIKIAEDTISFSNDRKDSLPHKIVVKGFRLMSIRGAVELFQLQVGEFVGSHAKKLFFIKAFPYQVPSKPCNRKKSRSSPTTNKLF